MGKKSSGKDKYKSEKDVANFLNESGDVNNMLEDGLQMSKKYDVGEKKKHKKRKLEANLMEKFKEGGKDKRAKHDVEGSEMGNEKDEKKDRRKKKDKYNTEAIEVEEVPNDTNMVGVEKAMKDNRTSDDAEVREVGYEEKNKKKKDKRTKYDSKAMEIGNEMDKGKDRKKMKKKDGAETVGVEDVSNNENMVGVEKARKDSNTSDYAGVRDVGCEEKKNKKKDGKNKKGKRDVEPSGVQDALHDTHVKKTDKASEKGKRTKSDTEGYGVIEAPDNEQNDIMKTIDPKSSDAEEMDRKKNRKKKKKRSDDLGVGLPESEVAIPVNASSGTEDNNILEAGSHRKSGRNTEVNDDNVGGNNKGRKKKAKSSIEKETPKRVSFSDHVEVFPASDDGPTDEENPSDKDGLVQGKRFSEEEDEMIKKAVFDYIEQHNLGEEGVDMILHCKGHKEIKNCWKEIATALPWRPYQSIYYRGHILFERDESHKWTEDDYELIRTFREKHGNDWRTLGDAIGRHRLHVKDTWRRIKLPNQKKGQWSQDEYQGLFNLVNMDLRMKATEERKSKHGMLRDNIAWGAISDKLSTRSISFCCTKWYSQLTSSMVAEGNWVDTDDYRMLDALQDLDACSMEDVDWDNLIEHRSGELCRKRWKQMVNHLGHLGTKSFAEQVDVLSERYCSDVLAAREAYDSRTPVDS